MAHGPPVERQDIPRPRIIFCGWKPSLVHRIASGAWELLGAGSEHSIGSSESSAGERYVHGGGRSSNTSESQWRPVRLPAVLSPAIAMLPDAVPASYVHCEQEPKLTNYRLQVLSIGMSALDRKSTRLNSSHRCIS